MIIRCLAIDDEPIALEKLSNYIQKFPYFKLVAACSSSIEAVSVLSNQTIDVIFTDINMPDVNGLDFISSLSNCPCVVFITAYPEHAIDSYKVGAIDYLLKPYSFADFQRAAERVKIHCEKFNNTSVSGNTQEEESIFVKIDYKWTRLNISSIKYIQAYGDYLKLHVLDSPTPHLIHSSMTQIFKSLPSYFMQVHRSYVINTKHIQEVGKSKLTMDGGTEIPVGNSYKENVVSFIENQLTLNRNN